MPDRRLDPAFVQAEINSLLAANPELLEDEALRADMIEGSTDAFEFISELLRRIGAAQVVAVGIDNYLRDLKERRDRMERREESLRALIFKVMQAADLRKVERPEATVFVRAGSRKVIVINELEIPENWVRIKREPDKAKIRADLIDGIDVPGCVLSNAEPALTIKTK